MKYVIDCCESHLRTFCQTQWQKYLFDIITLNVPSCVSSRFRQLLKPAWEHLTMWHCVPPHVPLHANYIKEVHFWIIYTKLWVPIKIVPSSGILFLGYFIPRIFHSSDISFIGYLIHRIFHSLNISFLRYFIPRIFHSSDISFL